MKLTFIVGALLLVSGFAQAASVVCIAGQLNANGTFKIVSQNKAQIAVLTDGAISLHTLKDSFALFKTKYNIKNAFNMKLVKALGVAGTYEMSGYVANANWKFADDGKISTSAEITIDTTALTGSIETNSTTADGQWAGTTRDGFVCTNAGVKI